MPRSRSDAPRSDTSIEASIEASIAASIDTSADVSTHAVDTAPSDAATTARNVATYRVTLMPSGWQFAAPSDTPILLAAQAAGIKLPSLCRNGTCRACLCQAHTGGGSAPVTYRIDWPGLSRDEKRDGWLLPCCAYAGADLVIDAPDAARAAL